ncbi:hypothetical protein [Candidatus Phytoplasma solani]|uniref:hypothetical protein n=1 Tax=Candidatus Phytoplasma solani TaxID=69896 RepID=UPI00358E4ED8
METQIPSLRRNSSIRILGVVQDSEFSDKKAIDQEIKKIIDQCYTEATTIMKANQKLLD